VLEVTWAGATDVGLVRERNEDAWTAIPVPGDDRRVFAICDGMGGHLGGDVASRITIERLEEIALVTENENLGQAIALAIRSANREIGIRSALDTGLRGMGTTCVALGIDAGVGSVVHVGDSRAYLLRDDDLVRLTRDHLWYAEAAAHGDVLAASRADRHVLSRCVGMGSGLAIDLREITLAAGDVFLLASDGLHGLVPDAEIQSVLERSPPRIAVASLIELALAHGGDDNVTAIALRVDAGRTKARGRVFPHRRPENR